MLAAFRVLPTALLVVIFASPVFSSPAPVSSNDPFKLIAAHASPKHNDPVCCLKPLPSSNPVDEDVLLSFEEWKEKQSALHAAQVRDALPPVQPSPGEKADGSSVVSSDNTSPGSGGSTPQKDSEVSTPSPGSTPPEPISPHFRVPLTDRFNYANLDCSSRVHLAHRGAKSPSSILSSKRDKYMLSPCKAQDQFVVVELCDDIRIDTVQLANFEFFSGVFKDFTVSVAKTYTEGWTVAGTYRAKNVRGVQSFHPPTTLRDFYRYIRIDFHSHYGSEYYCPVSLLRVYGLTHLEHWKWDLWETESREKERAIVALPNTIQAAPVLETRSHEQQQETAKPPVAKSAIQPASEDKEPEVSSPLSSPSPSSSFSETLVITPISTPAPSQSDDIPTTNDTLSTNNDSDSVTFENNLTHSTNTFISTSFVASSVLQEGPSTVPSPPASEVPTLTLVETVLNNDASSTVSTSTSAPTNTNESSSSSSSAASSTSVSSSSISSSSSSLSSSSSPSSISTTPSPTPRIVVTSNSIPPHTPTAGGGGESIYRTIMNRLTALETNHTLFSLYIEQQNAAVREVIKRLGEDVGRLEGMSRAQAALHQKSVGEWERQRRRWEGEYIELIGRLEGLSEEITMEKRLGVAQLCLLLAVLVFMGLTRGSRTEHQPQQGNAVDGRIEGVPRSRSSMREWGRRHLSFNGEWRSRFRKRSASGSGSGGGSFRKFEGEADDDPRPKMLSTKSYPAYMPVEQKKVDFPSTAGAGASWRKEGPGDSRGGALEPIELNMVHPTTAPASAANASHVRTRTRTISNASVKTTTASGNKNNNQLQRTPQRTPRGSAAHNRNVYLQAARPATPTRSATTIHTPFRSAAPLMRSNSAQMARVGGSNGDGGGVWVGNVPKSAKKWARTAHLHEVKSPGLVAATRKGDVRDENMVVDVFSSPRDGRKGKGKEQGNEADVITENGSATVLGNSSPTLVIRFPNGMENEGDSWVDTDSLDGFESEQFGQQEAGSSQPPGEL